jgi:phospholipase/carboxylesterase
MRRVTRRHFTAMTGGTFASLACGVACRATEAVQDHDGRLDARPRKGVTTTARGERLGLDPERDATLRLPPNATTSPATPLPLLVYLHGATQRGEGMLRRVGPAADEAGIAVLAPDSRDITWDAIRGEYGRDIVFLNRALQRVFETVAIDPARVAIGGFSDGATYALSLGLINGDLFTHIIANSPGFIVDGQAHGKPKCFVSHGTSDQILPIEQCSRRLVPALQRRQYAVTYREFDGRHELPAEIAHDAMHWFVDTLR